MAITKDARKIQGSMLNYRAARRWSSTTGRCVCGVRASPSCAPISVPTPPSATCSASPASARPPTPSLLAPVCQAFATTSRVSIYGSESAGSRMECLIIWESAVKPHHDSILFPWGPLEWLHPFSPRVSLTSARRCSSCPPHIIATQAVHPTSQGGQHMSWRLIFMKHHRPHGSVA